MDISSSYNDILSQLVLNQMRAITSTYHLLMHFLMERGVGEVRGDQDTTRECYMVSLCDNGLRETLTMKELEVKGKDKQKPTGLVEELYEVSTNEA